MSEIHTIHSFEAVWQPGDVVLTGDSCLYVRASRNAMYPWGDANQHLDDHIEGGLSDEQLVRPLTLLVRHGQAIGGVLINEGETPELA
ncbi:hypothetical protein AB0N28_03800 [Streptomyces sp. NPDC051130]|uniref:hypothetical protein n=1 Tax=Streptomyces sp. NPDC051130 TaxID=3157223 RepID=UPI0034249A76